MAEVMNIIMKKYLFTAAAMMVAMTSCVKEADVVVPQDDDKVWVEFAAGVQTKVALNDGETNTVTWEENDKVSINGVEFAVKNESISDDKTSATFGAYVEPSFLDAENFTAVYPVEAVSWEGEYAPKVTIPTLQDGAANIVAMATVDNLESALAFRHVASFIKFQVPAEVSVVKLEVPEDSDDLLAGSFYDISFGVVDDKVTSITYSEVPYAATSITLSLPEDAKFQPATDYYVAVIPGVKKNLTLSFDDKVYKTWESVNIKQGMIAKVSAKIERNLAYKLSDEIVKEVAYTMGTEFTAPVLTGEMTGVVYASSNAEVATVSETGEVTILAVGTTTITASAEENNTHLAGSASYTLTVAAAPKVARNLAFDPESVTVTYGEAFTAPELTGETAGVVYTSTNPEVATVTPDGVVEIVKAGTTTITASAEANDTHLAGSASYTLTVNKAARTLSFSPTSVTATLGKAFTSPVLSGVKDGETVVYSSSKPSVATIDNNGAVTLVDAGETTITATIAEDDKYLEGSAEYTLTVEYEKSTWGIKGNFEGGNNWATLEQMNIDGSTWFFIKGVKFTSAPAFKFNKSDDTGWWIGSSTTSNITVNKVSYTGGNDIKLSSKGTYDIYFSAGLGKFYVTNTGSKPTNPDYYLAGDAVGGWDDKVKLSYVDGKYVATGVTMSKAELKIKAAGTWDESYGSGGNLTIGANNEVWFNGGNSKVTEPGTYNVTFDLNTRTLKLEKAN